MTENTTTFEDGSTIETWGNGGFSVSGRMAMERYNLIWLKTYLPFEIKTGMVVSHRQTALDVARAISGINFRTRKQAMVWLDTIEL